MWQTNDAYDGKCAVCASPVIYVACPECEVFLCGEHAETLCEEHGKKDDKKDEKTTKQ